MDEKKTVLVFLALTLVGWAGGYLLTSSYDFGFCFSDLQTYTFDVSCHEGLERLGNPIFYGMPALALVFLVLLFTPHAFLAWKKFAIWFVPLAALLFALYPDPGSGDLFSPYPEQVFRWVSGLYVTVSLLIIIWKSFSSRGKSV